MHDPDLTTAFINAIGRSHLGHLHRCPADVAPYSPWAVADWLQSLDLQEPITIVAFSAGVVGAIAAAQRYRRSAVRAFIALDGWGVPLVAPFPIYRLSHDGFTHWTSLGYGQQNFYADPAVAHLDLWRSPDRVTGWRIQSSNSLLGNGLLSAIAPLPSWGDRTTAAQWIRELLQDETLRY